MKTHRQHSMLTISCYSLLSHSCVILCDPLNGSTPGFPVLNYLQRLLKLIRVESVMPSGHLILCSPLLLLPSIFPSIRVFSSESALCIRWPKYWSFSFSISPSQGWFPLCLVLFRYWEYINKWNRQECPVLMNFTFWWCSNISRVLRLARAGFRPNLESHIHLTVTRSFPWTLRSPGYQTIL